MALLDTLKAIGKVQVGASAEYAVVQATESRTLDSDGVLKETWRLRCFLMAASASALPAAITSMKAELSKRGESVTLTELGGAARTLPAESVPLSGSARGYPRVTVETDPAGSVGAAQYFTLIAETLIPVHDDLPLHTWSRTESRDSGNLITTTQRGDVRVANGFVASQWISTNVIEPTRQSAVGLGLTFEHEVETSDDETVGSYRWTTRPPSPTQFQGSGVSAGQISDVEQAERGGRRARRVTGYFEGPSALQLALAQRPPAGTNRLVRAQVSKPRQPDGRVDFSYEAERGVESPPGFPQLTVFAWRGSIERIAGGRRLIAAAFASGAPLLWRGPQEPYQYVESMELEYIGARQSAQDALAPLMDAEALVTTDSFRHAVAGDRFTVSIRRAYIFAAEQALPALPEVAFDFADIGGWS